MTRLAVYTKLVSPECSLTPRTETLESLPLIGAEGSILLRKIVKGMQISEMWDAVRVARIEAGLPVCGHKDCEIPFDAERITEEDVAEVIRRAEDEVFALLKTPVAAATSNSSHRAATTSPKRHRPGREDAAAQLPHDPVLLTAG